MDPHKFLCGSRSQKCPSGSGSRPPIFYSDTDPKGVKQFQKQDKTPFKISKQKVLQKDPYFYVSSSNEPVDFLGFFTSWIRADPDPKH